MRRPWRALPAPWSLPQPKTPARKFISIAVYSLPVMEAMNQHSWIWHVPVGSIALIQRIGRHAITSRKKKRHGIAMKTRRIDLDQLKRTPDNALVPPRIRSPPN